MAAAPALLLPPAPPPAVSFPQASAPRRHGYGAPELLLVIYAVATIAMLMGAGGKWASYMHPIIAVLVGIILHQKWPMHYIGFSLSLWWYAPFVRRVLDLHSGFNITSPVLLGPPIVALLSVMTLARYTKDLRGSLYAPFLFILAAIGYGYSIGLVNGGLVPASYALLTWIAPLAFGVHLGIRWRSYEKVSVVVSKVFDYALPVLAVYGIYQFVKLPAWDRAWMLGAQMKSIGIPLPFLLRVFGTMNTPGPYASFLCCGILLALRHKGFWRYPGVAMAMVAILLTGTRAAWIAFILGFIVQQLSQPVLKVPKKTIAIIVISLLALPLASKFKDSILPRLNTLQDIQKDHSFKKRIAFTESAANTIVESAEGAGLGNTGGAVKLRDKGGGVRSLDNGFLEVFFVLGWPGGTLFFLGVGGLMFQSFRFADAKRDPFAATARAVAVAMLSILPIGDIFTGPSGTLLWSFVGLSIGAHAYHLTTGLAVRSRAFEAARAAARALPPPLKTVI